MEYNQTFVNESLIFFNLSLLFGSKAGRWKLINITSKQMNGGSNM